jgi:glycosyltransferase involved in cell wall biosynthesis
MTRESAGVVGEVTRGRAQVLTDSTMWQSEDWSRFVDTVYRFSGRRWLNHPVLIALRLVWRRRRYQAVLTTGNRVSLYYAVACRLLRLQQRQVIAQLYLNQRPGPLNWLHDRLMHWALGGAFGVIINARAEEPILAERFGVPPSRVRFVDYHTTVEEPQRLATDGYMFAGGRNFRDYDVLLRAMEGFDAELVVVCGEDQLRDVEVPRNARILREIPWDEYMDLLRNAGVVVIPLSSEVVPAGQVSLLEAMAYGKPVVVTRQIGTADYVREGIDGFMCELANPEDLRSKLKLLLDDPDLRRRVGNAAFEAVETRFTIQRHVDEKIAAIEELAGLPSRG